MNNSWCESCARKNVCYVPDIRPKCYVPTTNTAIICPNDLNTGDELYFDKPINISRMDKVKNVIRNNYVNARCGLFFTPNWVGDPMSTLWEEDGVTIDICYEYEYFEVFGLTEEEENELLAFYNSLYE